MVRTYSYYKNTSDIITIGNEYYFGELVDGDNNLLDILESGCVAIWNDNEELEVVCFEIVKENNDPLEVIVKVVDIV